MLTTLLSGETASVGLSVSIILGKATLLLLAALAATRAMERGSAVSRHLVWLTSLAGLLLIPALASWSPLRLAVLPPASGIEAVPLAPPVLEPAPVGEAPAAPAIIDAPRAATAPPNVEATVSTVRGIVSPDTRWFGILSDPKLLFAIWATVALVFAGWLGCGALSVARIIRRSRTLDTPEWLNPLWEVADRLGLEEAPRLVRSDDAKMPFACGLRRPTIVLPAESDGWTLDRRRAVLLHELAHIRRRDLLGHTVGRFACALYWFHPLVWTAARRLRSESERACDDLALTCGARASDYAEHLLDIVIGVRHHATPAVALAMARRKEFEGRMLAILDPELRRTGPSRAQTIGLVGALAVLSLVVGAAVPVARAADGTSGSPDRAAASAAAGEGLGAGNLADRALSRAVRTVERRRIEVTSSQVTSRVDSIRHRVEQSGIGSNVGGSVGSAIGRSIGRSIGRGVGEMVGEIVDGVVSSAADGAVRLSVPSVEALTAVINAPAARQGRSDERPALLANVLRSDTSAALRRVAAWGLAQYADADVAVQALAGAVRGDRDPAVREMAAWALADAEGGNSTVIEALSTAMRRDASVKVRATAAWALGNVGDRDAVEALSAALGDTSRSVRLRAAWAIGNVEPREAPRAVIDMLSDPEAEVRRMAAWVLYNVQDPAAVPALDAAMQREKDKETQHALIRAMAATGEKSVDAIKRLIDSNDPEVRSAAIHALAGGGASGPWPWPWPMPRPQP